MKKGYKLSEEHKRKLSEANKGQKLSEEQKRKQIEGLKKYYKTHNSPMLYGTHSEETKKKISEILKEHYKTHNGNRQGVKLSEETKRKINEAQKEYYKTHSAYNKGKKLSEETKRKISEAKKEYYKTHNSKRWGVKHSEEVKKKMSEAHNNVVTREKHRRAIIKTMANQKFKATTPEQIIKRFLEQLTIEFIPQYYLREIEHPYVADFILPDFNMVIEADGNYWHNYPLGTFNDMVRSGEIKEVGMKLVRLWEKDIKKMTLEEFEKIILTKDDI